MIYITPTQLLDKLKTVDGSGSGLDSDKLDGEEKSYYAKAVDLNNHVEDKNNPHAVTAEQLGADNLLAEVKKVDGANSGLDADQLDGQHGTYYAKDSDLDAVSDDLAAHKSNTNNPHSVTAAQLGASNILTEVKKVDGSNSGLDADLIDGQHGSYFAKASDLSSHVNDTGNPHNVTAAQLGASNILTQIKSVDGAGSGLDADKLDGKHYTDVIAPMVDLSNASSDYLLKRGEIAFYNFTSVMQLPLHIKTMDGTAYELQLLPNIAYDSDGGSVLYVKLLPNNTEVSTAFTRSGILNRESGMTGTFGKESGFTVGYDFTFTQVLITNRTLCKMTQAQSVIYGTSGAYGALLLVGSIWEDKTTVWSSLGTLKFNSSCSGVVLVKRIF